MKILTLIVDDMFGATVRNCKYILVVCNNAITLLNIFT
nr:MAG TPA: hypothetical protein [Caudoviricetes sp.]